MIVSELGGGGAEPVSVADAKVFCRIERSDEDDLIAALIEAARQALERETRAVLVRRNFRIALDVLPADRMILVPRTPLVAVTAVTAFGADGTSTVLPAADAAARLRGADVLRLSEAAAAAAAKGIEIEFTAGLDATSVPEAYRLAIKRIVAANYDARGTDAGAGVVPKAARDLVALFRELRIR